jgi:hypothetical protein
MSSPFPSSPLYPISSHNDMRNMIGFHCLTSGISSTLILKLYGLFVWTLVFVVAFSVCCPSAPGSSYMMGYESSHYLPAKNITHIFGKNQKRDPNQTQNKTIEDRSFPIIFVVSQTPIKIVYNTFLHPS